MFVFDDVNVNTAYSIVQSKVMSLGPNSLDKCQTVLSPAHQLDRHFEERKSPGCNPALTHRQLGQAQASLASLSAGQVSLVNRQRNVSRKFSPFLKLRHIKGTQATNEKNE